MNSGAVYRERAGWATWARHRHTSFGKWVTICYSQEPVGRLRIVLLNACSIRNKSLEFQPMISTTPMDIIGITETWLDTARRDFEGKYRHPGYSLFHQDRAGRVWDTVMFNAKHHLSPPYRNRSWLNLIYWSWGPWEWAEGGGFSSATGFGSYGSNGAHAYLPTSSVAGEEDPPPWIQMKGDCT